MNTINTLGEIRPITQQPEAVASFLDQIAAFELEREAAIKAGLPALERLAKIANGDTGQSATVRRFLLSLYNGHAYPLNPSTLRSLDKALFEDTMCVLRLDARATLKEVHCYFDNGSQLFSRWAAMEVSK